MIELYDTGQIHTNGWPIYRQVGKPMSAPYYIYTLGEMYLCGSPYRDEYGSFDGEAICEIHNYQIVNKKEEK